MTKPFSEAHVQNLRVAARRRRTATMFDRFKAGEETPYNGGVVHSCRTCGAIVDMHDLAVHDAWHKVLLTNDAASTVIEAAALRLLDRMGAHMDPGAPSHKMFWEEFRKAIR